jgi:hypothetical protein
VRAGVGGRDCVSAASDGFFPRMTDHPISQLEISSVDSRSASPFRTSSVLVLSAGAPIVAPILPRLRGLALVAAAFRRQAAVAAAEGEDIARVALFSVDRPPAQDRAARLRFLGLRGRARVAAAFSLQPLVAFEEEARHRRQLLKTT